MNNSNIGLITFLAFASMTGSAQSVHSELDSALALFFQTRIVQALPLFEAVVQKDAHNDVALNWLAETYRRLGRKLFLLGQESF
jgi:hypothetical protein